MVSVFVQNDVEWRSPSPLWVHVADGEQIAAINDSFTPAILRFASDDFMDELTRLLAFRPENLTHYVAKKETWRLPMPKPPVSSVVKVKEPISRLSQRKSQLQQRKKFPRNILPFYKADTLDSPTQAKDEQEREKLSFKLYQSGQLRFYLVSASLVCARPGRPDRKVNTAKQESTSFVVRRLIRPEGGSDDPGSWDEYAFVQTENGPVWDRVASHSSIATQQIQIGEERLPFFELAFTDSLGRPRRIHSGLIPIGRREEYLATPSMNKRQDGSNSTDQVNETDNARANQILVDLFISDVTARWRIIVEQVAEEKTGFDIGQQKFPKGVSASDQFTEPSNNTDKKDLQKRSLEQIQTASWYILLDFAKFLEMYVPSVWGAILNPATSGSLNDQERALYDVIDDMSLNVTALRPRLATSPYGNSDIRSTLRQALVAVATQTPEPLGNITPEQKLEGIDTAYDRSDPKAKELWPGFLFPLSDYDELFPIESPHLDDWMDRYEIDIEDYYLETGSNAIDAERANALARIDTLKNLVAAALPAEPQQSPPEPLFTTQSIDNPNEAKFLVRCVYERPNCNPFALAVVSRPSQYFEMASFFDPDAPGRSVLIPMPIDFSPAGLRKYKKNAGFILSDMLCAQMKRTRRITLADLVLSVLPWPFHKDLPQPGPAKSCSGPGGNFGLICSLSIPIVTLCAMILLIIMVLLFDLFFRWIPYLFVCFPIPGLNGKK